MLVKTMPYNHAVDRMPGKTQWRFAVASVTGTGHRTL
jgi:hypothetical protein